MTGLIVGAAILALLVGLITWAFYKGRQGGIDAAERAAARDTVAAQDRMGKAAAEAPRTPDEVHERLRKGGGL